MSQRHVDFLLVAEFDIDRGPTLAHQYPAPLSSSDDSNFLAELMLPDQTHVRTEDWTVFFLPRSTLIKSEYTKAASAYQEPDMPGDDMVYVLSLVNTKHDKNVKRGAQVKALAIVTRHCYLHVYKPVLLLALDDFYKNPTIATLETLYSSVNSMDLSSMPQYNSLEKLILVASDQDAVFHQPGEPTEQDKRYSENSSVSSPISTVSDRLSQILLGNSQNSGAVSPSMPTYQRDTQHFSTYIEYNNIKVPVRIPLATFPELVGDFSISQLVGLFCRNATNSPNFLVLHPELTTNGPSTHPVMVLMNALLTEKRVVFLGQNRPSGEVAQHVLAACALGSGGCGVLRGFTERAFPYTDLSKVEDLMNVRGFIAGVTNSVFELHPEWWDILCNLDTGSITISPDLQNSFVEPSPTGSVFSFSALANSIPTTESPRLASHLCDYSDAAFMADVELTIQERASEQTIRMKFRDWTHRLVRMAAAHELDKFGDTDLLAPRTVRDLYLPPGSGWVWPDEQSKQRDLQQNMNRVEGWRGTLSYQKLVQQQKLFWQHQVSAASFVDPTLNGYGHVVTLDLWYQIDRLRILTQDQLSLNDSAQIYITLAKEVRSDMHITEVLAICPLSQGGLQWLASGCLHPRDEARLGAAQLLQRIEGHPIGVHFVAALTLYFRSGFNRLKRELAAKHTIGTAHNGHAADVAMI